MRSEAELRNLLHHGAEGFVRIDGGFRILELQAEGTWIEERPAAPLIGKTLWEAWPDLQGTGLHTLCTEAMRERVPVALEHGYVWPGGRRGWIAVRAFASENGLAIFFRDVTDDRHAEVALRDAHNDLMEASRRHAMGVMASTLAHELNQPLTAATNYVATARFLLRSLGGEDANEARSALEGVMGAIERIGEIVRRARSFVDKGRIEAELHDIGSLISDACLIALPHARREMIELEFRIDRAARWVTVDGVQIQQVLLNLIRNAIEAMKRAPRRCITIATAPAPGGCVEISVADTGSGLGEAGSALFSPRRSMKPDGMGLGLAISRTIVEAHGGSIAARNAPGGGAEFRFTVPGQQSGAAAPVRERLAAQA
jgi:signal transduction histidine kinase